MPKVVPCANDTLAPPFSPGHYLYTAHEADPFTGEVAIKTACTGGCHSVSVLVDGKTVDAAHVPLNNATDGPGPDKSAPRSFCAALLTSKSPNWPPLGAL